MQSLTKISKSAVCVRGIPEGRRHFGIASTEIIAQKVSGPEKKLETEGQRHIYKSDNGMIIVRERGDIFYIRHDIIFAKAGDVFYMPRKVPDDFKIDSAEVLSKEEFEKYITLS